LRTASTDSAPVAVAFFVFVAVAILVAFLSNQLLHCSMIHMGHSKLCVKNFCCSAAYIYIII
jgi:hypothetical protein